MANTQWAPLSMFNRLPNPPLNLVAIVAAERLWFDEAASLLRPESCRDAQGDGGT